MDPVLSDVRRFFMVTWSIKEEFGGMTSMCLYRSGLFDRYGIQAPVITFDANPKYGQILDTLRMRGALASSTQIINIYEDHRRMSFEGVDPVQGERLPQDDIPSGAVYTDSHDTTGGRFSRTTTSSDGSVVYCREYFREDGSVFVLDELRPADDRDAARRLISVVGPDGLIYRQYDSAASWYRSWLVSLSEGEPTLLILDSAYSSKFAAAIDDDNIVKVAIFHSNHIEAGGEPHKGTLGRGRKHIVDRPHNWDGIVFLTEQQRADFVSRFGATSNLFTISNPRARPESMVPHSLRASNRGVVISRLVHGKNIESAVAIIDEARKSIPDIKLDIYGDGPEKESLQALIDDRVLGKNIILHGYKPGAADELSNAVFSLLTSRHEGQSLAIMESQARGCPPVSFDIRYGPPDLIQDGENGFLVPFGDTEAAARRVVELCADQAVGSRLARRAWETSVRFGDDAIAREWIRLANIVWAERQARTRLTKGAAEVHKVEVHRERGVRIEGSIIWELARSPQDNSRPFATLRLLSRTEDFSMQGRLVTDNIRREGMGFVAEVDREVLEGASAVQEAFDFYIIVVWNNSRLVLRVPSPLSSRGLEPYPTAYGNVSFRQREAAANSGQQINTKSLNGISNMEQRNVLRDWIGQKAKAAISSRAGVAVRDWMGIRGGARANHEMLRVEVPASVVVYFGDIAAKTYQLDQWLPILEQLDRKHRVLLVFRKVGAMRELKSRTSLRMLFVRRFEDLTRLYDENDYRLCIYVNNGVNNFQSLTFARMVHVHVNHGESDKVSMVSNQAKAYDNIMIAGPAARERHRSVLIDFDEAKLLEVGRPQLDIDFKPELVRIQTRTVMYAPTWEGENEANNYTSLDVYGRKIISALLQLPDIRVVYKPHPRVESSNAPAIAEAHQSILNSIELANKGRQVPHVIAEQGNVLAMLGAIDVLISDVSSVGLDFLYLFPDRPLILTDRRSDRSLLLRDAPVAEACPIIDRTSLDEVTNVISVAVTEDTYEAERSRLRRFYFGDFARGDSTEAFVNAIDTLIERRSEKLKDVRFHASSPESDDESEPQ